MKYGQHIWWYAGGELDPIEVRFDTNIFSPVAFDDLSYITNLEGNNRRAVFRRELYPTKIKALTDRILWGRQYLHGLIRKMADCTDQISKVDALIEKTYTMIYEEQTDAKV